MKYFGAGLSESHKELNRIIRKPELIEQTKELFLEIHGKLHSSHLLPLLLYHCQTLQNCYLGFLAFSSFPELQPFRPSY